jgi:hypothetical protein
MKEDGHIVTSICLAPTSLTSKPDAVIKNFFSKNKAEIKFS